MVSLLVAALFLQGGRRLSVGDRIEIVCPQSAALCVRRTISESGTVTLADLPPITLVRLTAGDAAHRIEEALVRSGRLPEAEITVRVLPSRRRTVTITGYVGTSGEFAMRPGTSLQDLLQEAAVNPSADLSRVVVESTDAVYTVDARAGIWYVRPGDRIEILQLAPRQEAFVLGGVERPGAVEIGDGTTAEQAVAKAGGVGAFGRTDGWVLRRGGQVQKLEPGTLLRAGDTLEVPVVENGSFVMITGSVSRPGRIPFRKNMKLSEAIVAVGGPLPDANFADIEIRSLGGAVKHANLAAIRAGKQPDVALAFGDLVLVPKMKGGESW